MFSQYQNLDMPKIYSYHKYKSLTNTKFKAAHKTKKIYCLFSRTASKPHLHNPLHRGLFISSFAALVFLAKA